MSSCVVPLAWALAGCDTPPVPSEAGLDAATTDGAAPAADSGADFPAIVERDAPADRPGDIGAGVLDEPPADLVPIADAAADAPQPDTPPVDASGRDAAAVESCPRSGDAGALTASVARLVFPLSDFAVTSHRPDLRWALAGDGARVEICRDRGCTSLVAAFDATETHARPPVALTRGVYFWRIFERTGGALASTPSSTWHFRVGARDTAVDTAWASGFDVNNDGYHDILQSRHTSAAGFVSFLFLGGAGGPGRTPDARYEGRASPLGDVNGDGFADAAIGRNLHLGGPAGLSARPIGLIPGDVTGLLTSLGDTDDDGYGDVIVAEPGPPFYRFQFRVFPGGPEGFSAGPSFEAVLSGGHRYGAWVAPASDLNGDRRSDFILKTGSTVFEGDEPGIYIVRSGDGAWFESRRRGCGGQPTFSTEPIGDVNGDGYADLAATCYRDSDTVFLAGGACGSPAAPTRSPGRSEVVPIGDVNGDGCGDLYVWRRGDGAATIHHGVAGATVATAFVRVFEVGSFTPVHDVNGDGYDDMLVYGDPDQRLYLGGPSGLATTPSATLTLPP